MKTETARARNPSFVEGCHFANAARRTSRGGMANTSKTLSEILAMLAAHGVACDVFGGWAEEMLGLRAPGPHSDIDLIYRADGFTALDAALANLENVLRAVPAKLFPHKRAFLFRETLCEITLVTQDDVGPVTYFWGDLAYRWEQPLLHPEVIAFGSSSFSVVSAPNLVKYRIDRKSRQPDRWREFAKRNG